MSTTTIYGLYDKRDDTQTIRYVGVTSSQRGPRHRLHQHRTEARYEHQRGHHTPKSEWTRSIGPENLELKVIDFSREDIAIQHFRKLPNHPGLLNQKSGDRNRSERTKIDWTPDVIQKMGTVSDGEIADELGCSRPRVAEKRKELGIDAFEAYRGVTKQNVREIRLLYEALDVTQKSLAEAYDCSPTTICNIVNGKRHQKVTTPNQ